MSFDPSQYRSLNEEQEQTSPQAEFDPSRYRPLQTAQQASPQPAPEPTRSSVGATDFSAEHFAQQPIVAAIGGLSHGVATGMEAIGDFGSLVLEKLGAISPKASKDFQKGYGEFLTKYAKYNTDKKDVFNKAQDASPATANLASFLGGAAVNIAGAPGKIETASKLGTFLANTAAQSLYQGAMGAGTAISQGGDPATSGAASGVFTAGLMAAGEGLSYAAGKAAPLIKDKISQGIQSIANKYGTNPTVAVKDRAAQMITEAAPVIQSTKDDLYTQLRNIPGKLKTAPYEKILKNMEADNGAYLNPAQKQFIGAFRQLLGGQTQATTREGLEAAMDYSKLAPTHIKMDQAVELSNLVSKGGESFMSGANPLLHQNWKQLKSVIDTQMSALAQANNKGSLLKQTRDFYSNVYLPAKDLGILDLARTAKTAGESPYTQQAYNQAVNKIVGSIDTNPNAMNKFLTLTGKKGGEIIADAWAIKNLEKLADAPVRLDPNHIVTSITGFLKTAGKQLSPEAKKPLEGIAKLAKDIGGVEGQSEASRSGGQFLASITGSQVAAGALGGIGGYMLGSSDKDSASGLALGAAGMLVGGVAGNQIARRLAELYNSDKGKFVLRGIAENKPWAQEVGRVIRGLIVPEVAKVSYTEAKDDDENKQ